MSSLSDLELAFKEHSKQDAEQFTAIHKRLDGLATKDDTREIMNAIRTVKFGIGFFKVSGQTIIFIGAVILAFATIFGRFRELLIWLVRG